MPCTHSYYNYVLFGIVSASAVLDSGASHNFIAAPQFTRFSNNVKKSFFCPGKPMEVHLADNSSAVSHQIVHLPLLFADGAVHTAESWAVPALNHAIILGMPFLHKFNPII